MHEDFAIRVRSRQASECTAAAEGLRVLETIPHPTPTRDFNNVVLKIKAHNPDLVIPANYYNEYVLLARTMQQQHVRPKGIYSVLGGAASSYKFVRNFLTLPSTSWTAITGSIQERQGAGAEEKGRGQGSVLHLRAVHELFTAFFSSPMRSSTRLGRSRQDHRDALANSTFSGHVMPYGPTKFVNGQNQGAAPVNTQVLDNDIKVILPPDSPSRRRFSRCRRSLMNARALERQSRRPFAGAFWCPSS